jgi:hypothetical protein
MSELTPCDACSELILNGGRSTKPHPALHLVEERPFRGAMLGGWEETTYRCKTCSAVIEHTNDKNEFAPFWWLSNGSA